MKAFERLIRATGQFVVGFGSGIALVCVFVIVTTDGLGSPKAAKPAEVVRLDPVVVSISAERFRQIQAEMGGDPALVRKPDPGLGEG